MSDVKFLIEQKDSNKSLNSKGMVSVSKHSMDGKLIGTYTISPDGIYEALEFYSEYLSKQPFNAKLKNNSVSF